MDKLCVQGLGYIGLPTAAMFASHGFQVLGVDVDPTVLKVLKEGNTHIDEPGISQLVDTAIASGQLTVSSQPETSDAFIISVPTPINADKRADMSYVVSAARSTTTCLQPGNLVVLESTVPPGTTQDVVKPILEESGLKAGSDFLLAYSPERVMPGRILDEIVNNSRVVGGVDEASAKAAQALYSTFVKGDIVLTDCSTAEMVKLMENTSRDVGIALANEYARLADEFGVDVWGAIDIANKHPRVNILSPGPGVGGHCISVDPWFLVEAAPHLAPLIHHARRINDEQPEYVANMVEETLSRHQRGSITSPSDNKPPAPTSEMVIGCLGLSYKGDVGDIRESPAIAVVKALLTRGYTIKAFDPVVKNLSDLADVVAESMEEAVAGADCLLLLVDHTAFQQLDIGHLASVVRQRLVIDTRRMADQGQWSAHGFKVIRLGDGRLRWTPKFGQVAKRESRS